MLQRAFYTQADEGHSLAREGYLAGRSGIVKGASRARLQNVREWTKRAGWVRFAVFVWGHLGDFSKKFWV